MTDSLGYARMVDATPNVANTSDRDVRFPSPAMGQKIFVYSLNAIQQWNGTAWDTVFQGSLGVFNVKDFGAQGDGLTDDTAAIQACIAAAALVFGTVDIPVGTYHFMGITVPVGVSLRGAGMDIASLVYTPTTGNAITVSGIKHVFEGFSVFPLTTSTGDGITAAGFQFSSMTRVRVRNFVNGLSLTDSYYTGAYNCAFDHNTQDGIHLGLDCNAMGFYDCTSTVNAGAGAYLKGSRSVVFSGGSFELNAVGLDVVADTGFHTATTLVQGVYFEGNTTTEARVRSLDGGTTRPKGTTIEGCYFQPLTLNTVDAIQLQAHDGVTIRGNTFDNLSSWAYQYSVTQSIAGTNPAFMVENTDHSTLGVLVGAGAITQRLPLVFDVRDYGAKGDGVTNDTTAIQAALTAAGATVNRKTVLVPNGLYMASQLIIKNGVRLVGMGVGGFGSVDAGGQYGTEIRQIAGTGSDLIIFVGNAFGGATYVGPQEISNMILMGDTTAGAGSGIKFRSATQNATIQDTVTLRNLLIRGFKEDGISVPAGAVPLHVQDVNLLFNGRYGINYVHSNTQAVHFDNVGGDGNLAGLIRVSNVTDYGSVLFTNIKSEKRINTDYGSVDGQENAILLNNCSGPIAIHGLTHVSSIPDGGNFKVPGAGILIDGAAAPQLSFGAVAVRVRPGDTGTSYTLQDTTNTKTIPTTVHHGFYGASATVMHRLVLGASQDVLGLTAFPRGAGDPEQQLSGVTPMRTWFETDQAANEKGWCLAASGGQFSERTLNDDGTTGTVYRSVTRVGSVPSKVTYAVPIAVQSTNAQIYSGSGSPEGVVVAAIGSIFMRTNGGADTTFYVKESGAGNTGWIANGSAPLASPTFTTKISTPRTVGTGTSHVAGDYALSAGWGNTATVSTVAARDSAGRVSITCNGTGILANPTVTLTYKDGTWTVAPVSLPVRADINAPSTATFVPTSDTATTAVWTFLGTPVAGTVYTVSFLTEGK